MPTELERLIFQLEANTKGLRSELKAAENTVQQSTSKMRRSFLTMDKAVQRTSRAVFSLRGAIVGLAAGAALRGMIKTIADFTTAMSGLKAVTSATESQMRSMETVARSLGATTKFSAAEAAAGMEFLGRAGFKTNQIIDAIGPSLDLAAAGNLDLARAADIASNVLTAFNLDASEMGRVSDIMAATASRANTSVEQLAQAMKFVAPIASEMGASVEDTSAAIAILSNNGIQAEMAGSGLRNIMAEITTASDQLKGHLGGVTIEQDGLVKTMLALKNSSLGTGAAFDEFNKRGGNALLKLKGGAEGLKEFAEALSDVEGEAKRIADVKMDNIAGDMLQLVSAVKELFLVAGSSGFTGAIRASAQAMTEFFRSLGDTSAIVSRMEGAQDAAAIMVNLSEEIGQLQANISSSQGNTMGAFGEFLFGDTVQDLDSMKQRLETFKIIRQGIIDAARMPREKPGVSANTGVVDGPNPFALNEGEISARGEIEKALKKVREQNDLLGVQAGLQGDNINFLEQKLQLEQKIGRALGFQADTGKDEFDALRALVAEQERLTEVIEKKQRAEDFKETIKSMKEQAQLLQLELEGREKAKTALEAEFAIRKQFKELSSAEEQAFGLALERIEKINEAIKSRDRKKAFDTEIESLERSNRLLQLKLKGEEDDIVFLKARQTLAEALGITVSELSEEEIASLDKRTKEQILLNRQLKLQNEIVQAGERIFDRFGDGIVRTMQEGTSATEAFRNAAVAALFDIQREMLKLLVFEPLKKSLFGAIGGVISTGASSFFGGGSTPSGGSGVTDFLSEGFAKGAAFNAGKVTPFATGGVVNSPTIFPMANGAGLMGEAGPEGILPLSRGKNGKLGVNAQGMNGGGAGTVVYIDARNSNGEEALQATIKQAISEAAPVIINSAVIKTVSRRQKDPSLFGGSSGDI